VRQHGHPHFHSFQHPFPPNSPTSQLPNSHLSIVDGAGSFDKQPGKKKLDTAWPKLQAPTETENGEEVAGTESLPDSDSDSDPHPVPGTQTEPEKSRIKIQMQTVKYKQK